ncbi:9-O-acetylesterase [Sphingomonas sabuli]|uniref:9-O-acetylesterase n=1 Tax=Sphingomonas sabuli TaxID=2764186 RepID=A0A7G9KZR5_9SPHN|nr:sialate O-acetylesterase [Sphingomonas sabuli]QNM81864.1 9-O-acetylesterase [Sphingomonas sabuli]
MKPVAAILLFGTASTLHAAPKLDPMFATHSVVQRGAKAAISGTAAPGEHVSVSLGRQRADGRADASGRWLVRLPAVPSGRPTQIEVRAASGTDRADDVLIGDVWLCSGQSNMELPVSRALNAADELSGSADTQMRLLTIATMTATAPRLSFEKAPAWEVASPDTVAPFSAACYFMGRDLRQSQDVPIGLVDATWGGTAIRAWLDSASAAQSAPDDVALLTQFGTDPIAANRRFGERWQQWWARTQSTRPWAEPDALNWKPMKVGFWENWGDPAFASFNGLVWARATVTLTEAEAAQGARLTLGVIDEIDETWVNGVAVGYTFGWDAKRDYPLHTGLLRPGKNSIVVNINDSYAFGGFQGPEGELALRLADGTVKPLAPTLEYARVPPEVGSPPRAPWDQAAGLSLIYNAMIAPLGATGLKGIAWYQGETDGGSATGYAERLGSLVSGWRAQFEDAGLPFLVVGLPGWGSPPVEPRPSGWAEVRDAQRRVAAGDAKVALVPAIDVGDRLELHPPQKQAIGHRLARAAEALAYSADHARSGPQADAAIRSGNDVIVTFGGITGKLRAWSGAPLGFELCGPAQDSCRYARATIEGSAVRVTGDGRPVTRVRFGWADAPIVNLFDDVPLPVSSFELPVR